MSSLVYRYNVILYILVAFSSALLCLNCISLICGDFFIFAGNDMTDSLQQIGLGQAAQMKKSHFNSRKEQFKQNFEESEANYSQIEQPRPKHQNEGRPIQLIKITHSGKIEVNQQAIEIIASFNEPVGFVSLVGKTRTGKSCLLNRLLGIKGDGFKVDSSTASCTEGIWMWSVPFKNQKYNNLIFFLDTQGTDSLIKDPQNDVKIFTLAVLISSYFIYNSMGSIDQRSISDIEMVTALSKKIKMGEGDSVNADPNQLARFMPKFMWILRDFMLKIMDDKGRKISSNTYLQNCLTDQNTIGKADQTSKKIKRSIITYFPMRECLTLVRPVDEEDVLYNFNRLEDHRLRRQFVDGVNQLRNKIIDNTVAKAYAGKEITGYSMSVMIQNYANAFNSGGVPNIKSAWEQIAQDEGNQAYYKAIQVYERLLAQDLSEQPHGQQIYKIIGKLRNETLNQFKQRVGPNLKDYSEQLGKLEQLIDHNEQQILDENQKLCSKHNNQLIYNSSMKMRKRIQSNYYVSKEGKDELGKDINQIQENYNKGKKGKNSGEVLTQFLSTMTPILLNMKINNSVDQAELQRQKQLAQKEYNQKWKIQQQQNESLKNQMQTNKRTEDLKVGSKLPRKQTMKEKKAQQGCCSGGCTIM